LLNFFKNIFVLFILIYFYDFLFFDTIKVYCHELDDEKYFENFEENILNDDHIIRESGFKFDPIDII